MFTSRIGAGGIVVRYLLTWMTSFPPRIGSGSMARTSTPPSPERSVVITSIPIALNSTATRSSKSIGSSVRRSDSPTPTVVGWLADSRSGQLEGMDGYQVLWPRRQLASQAFQATDRVHSGEIEVSDGRSSSCNCEQEHLAAPTGSGVGGTDETVHRGIADYAAVVGPEDLSQRRPARFGRVRSGRSTYAHRPGAGSAFPCRLT